MTIYFIFADDLFLHNKNLEIADFIQTNRGGRKLLYNGYSFTQNRKFNNNTISWKCTSYKKYKCMARAVTRCVNETEYVKISKPIHTHPIDKNCKVLKTEILHYE